MAQNTRASSESTSYERILNSPEFKNLVAERTRFAWVLSIIMLIIYFGFILLVAFARDFMATKIGGGVTSVGVVFGLAVIVSAFILTGIYVRRANSRFDQLTRELTEGST